MATDKGVLEAVRQQRHAASARRMRRCFMTGEDCIFRPGGAGTVSSDTPLSVFVVMPYEPELDTVFEWSLKPYLEASPRNLRVERADQLSQMGYVVCERICRQIQDADIVAVDLSVNNTNCFYELGLAVGLGKHLLVLSDETAYDKLPHHWAELGITKVLKYPNVGFIGDEGEPIDKFVEPVPLEGRTSEMRIVSVLVNEDQPLVADVVQPRTIPVSFSKAVHAAVGVAIDRVWEERSRRPVLKAALHALADHDRAPEALADHHRMPDRLAELKKCYEKRNIVLLEPHGAGPPFAEAAAKINSAFACIIDLLDEHPLSYFWLGYCHARGINVIPIERRSPAGKLAKPEGHMLAFNIRALWYMQYQQDEPASLANTLGKVLAELIIKDVPTQQRCIFWERLTRKPQVHICTGAVHVSELQREVVGDWDLRTVSELVRHLSSTTESAVPQLEEPFYAPEEIDPSMGGTSPDRNRLSQYVNRVASALAGRNCLVVASSDVNPITEVVLAAAYRHAGEDWQRYCFAAWDRKMSKRGTVIALKGGGADDDAGARRCFSAPWHEELEPGERGFLLNGSEVLARKYRPQNDKEAKPFSVLAHLMILTNPFPPPDTGGGDGRNKDVIVLLNGVSGPGTFGLAELLTGGTEPEKERRSEGLLKQINETWDAVVPDEDGFVGIEALVEVSIKPSEGGDDGPSASAGLPHVRMKLSDDRQVVSWDLVRDLVKLPHNPRPLQA